MEPTRDMGAAGALDALPPEREITYCLVPSELASDLHEPLRRHFQNDPSVEVIVERRSAERRRNEERRSVGGKPPPSGAERRTAVAADGRRVGERRAPLAPAAPLPLPRRARRYAERISFFCRREPSGQHREDRDTARLVARIQSGDREAFAAIYSRYYDRIYGYLLVVLGSAHDAEDAAQEVFARAFAALPRYERRSQPFRAWLFRIARNMAVDALRLRERVEVADPNEIQRRRDERPEVVEPDLAELPILDWITDRDLALFVRRLSAPQRQVLMLRFTADLEDAEIADMMDRTPEDIRQLRSRALAFLRERLSAVGRREPMRGDGIKMKRVAKEAPVLRHRRWALHL